MYYLNKKEISAGKEPMGFAATVLYIERDIKKFQLAKNLWDLRQQFCT
jgi:hypothetical protein